MEAARICAEASRKLSAAEKRELMELLPFAAPTFSKLAKIGEDTKLQSNQVQKLLSPNYSILYEYTQLGDDEFKAAVEDRIVKPTVKRAELIEWRRQRRSPTKPSLPASLPTAGEIQRGVEDVAQQIRKRNSKDIRLGKHVRKRSVQPIL